MYRRLHSPRLDAEAILNEDSDDKEDHALYGHRKQVLSHHVPGQRGAEPVLTFRDTSRSTDQTF